MLSPVWTPIGSTFSMLQMMTTLSARSRITSISNSFQPITDCSISTSVTGLASRPPATIVSNSSTVVGDPAAGAAEGEGGADDQRQADLVQHLRASVMLWTTPLRGTFRPIWSIRILEHLAVLAAVDGVAVGADHLTRCTGEDALVEAGHGRVQPGLPAERGQHASTGVPGRCLVGQDLLDGPGRDRLDVRRVGELRVGHDRGRVAVDQDDPVPLLAQGPAGLDAGVVELAPLADDDRAGADDEDAVQVGSLGHRPGGM